MTAAQLQTIRAALATGRSILSESDTPAIDARLLLQHVLGANHTYIVAHDDEVVSAAQFERYRALLVRAADSEPIPYLVGHASFMGRSFRVSPATLIPRPETELLVRSALNWVGDRPHIRMVDVGTGSGCIAISLALESPSALIDAVDVSKEAVAVAAENALHHQVDSRVRFHLGHLLEPISSTPDLIVANLPYVATGEWPLLPESVARYEPATALDGGADGLDHFRILLAQIPGRLADGGAVMLEIGFRQGPAVVRLARQAFPECRVELSQDLSGHDRLVSILAE